MKVRRLATAAAALLLVPAAVLTAGPVEARDEPRIVGGSTVSPNAYAAQWPWLVVVEIDLGGLGPFREVGQCTGSLIAPQWVLTAAHCTVGENSPHAPYGVDQFTVYGGSPDTSRAGQLGTVDAVYTDPAYTPTDFFNPSISAEGDVGLLHLTAPVTGVAQPYLAVVSPTGPTVATALGWGKTSGSGDTSPTLKSVQVTVRPTDANTLYNAGPDGTCGGDSGGPLARGWIIIGTTSYGDEECATDSYYADTASVTPWIMATTAGVAGSAQPRLAVPPRLTTRAVVVRANTSRVALTLPVPAASAGTVRCNRPASRTIAVPSRTVTTCTATSPGGSTTATYAVKTKRAARAVLVTIDGKQLTRVRRGATVSARAIGFPAGSLVSVRWGERRKTARASSTGVVHLKLVAPKAAGVRTIYVTGTGATTEIRAQAVRVR